MRGAPPPRVLSISPPSAGGWLAGAPALVAAGVDGLLLRAPELAPQRVEAAVRRLGASVLLLHLRTPGAGPLAEALGLGLHLPASADPAAWRPRIAGLLGQSCHDASALSRAAAAGCDYALLSPIFPPGSKPDDDRPPLGLAGLAALVDLAEDLDLPVLALGGIDADRAAGCVAAGAAGVAGISCFLHAGAVDIASARAIIRAVGPPSPPPVR